MRETLSAYCIRNGREEILSQWHPERNETETPDSVSYGSRKLIWWRCDHGHEWQSPVYARSGKYHGCPYCSGKRVAVGFDLHSLFPAVAAQWHPDKNADRKPEHYLPGSHESAWWRCAKGHEWRATIKSRVEGNGCPYCSGRNVLSGVNDLQTAAPLLAKEWHPKRNGDLLPSQVMPGSARRVWWKCEKGHEWQAVVHTRTSGKGCPVCSGKVIVPGENDLESYDPELARQWCHERNGILQPSRVSVCSNKAVWWQCDLGHQWKATVSSRSFNRNGCPYCGNRKLLTGFNDLKTAEPLVAAQWHPSKNAPLEPTMVMPGSTRRVWWKCSDGHEWKAIIYSRTGSQKCGCPVCAGKAPRIYR